MEQKDILPLQTAYHRRLALTSLGFKRFLHGKINWRSRLIGIKGARGVGKTTLLLQRIKESFANPDDTIWISLDNLWLKNHSLPELVEYLYVHGMRHIFFDEVHKHEGWSLLLKNTYDSYPGLNIVYTGSPMLEIDNSIVDLSRRQTVYTLPVMSFREYLAFAGVGDFPAVGIDELLRDHVEIAMEMKPRISALRYFGEYLDKGCYPFYKEAGEEYLSRLAATASLVIEADMPAVERVTYSTVEKTKKLLAIIAQSVPLMPNVSKLSQALATTRDGCLSILYALDRAQIISLLMRREKSCKHLASPQKIYLANTNLMAALCADVNIGNKRETFFNNQLQSVAEVTLPPKGDFLANGRLLFEVGGAGKALGQIKDEPGSYLAVDDTEIGSGNRIPLWMFGMLY